MTDKERNTGLSIGDGLAIIRGKTNNSPENNDWKIDPKIVTILQNSRVGYSSSFQQISFQIDFYHLSSKNSNEITNVEC